MRLFVAILIPPNVRKRISLVSESIRPLAKGKWVEEHNLHLTLAFLGEVPQAMLPRLESALRRAAADTHKFKLEFQDIAAIPERRPHILGVRIKPNPELGKLQSSVVTELRKIGLSPLAKEPHLTLVRLKGPCPKLSSKNSRLGQVIEVAEISLVQSTLTPKGPIYRPLKGLKLSSEGLKQAFRSVVAICLINPKKEVLLTWHREHKPNDWQFPQGGVENADSLETTAKRELNEEVGITSFEVLAILKKAHEYRWPKRLVEQGTDERKKPFIGQEVSLVIGRTNDVRPKLAPDPREAARIAWVPATKLLKRLGPVRRGIGWIAMVELKRLGLVAKDTS